MTQALSELTNDQKCIKIAVACGWRYFDDPITRISWFYGPNNPSRPKAELLKDSPSPGRLLCIADEPSFPDYLNSLDAMHEAEKVLINQDYGPLFAEWLDGNWHATAEQRAEAFGRTLGLWA